MSMAVLTGQAQSKPALPTSGEIKMLPLRGNIYVLTVAGTNIAVSVGKDGVLLVDSGQLAHGGHDLLGHRRWSRVDEEDAVFAD
jgi:hypothetical protein